MCCTRAVLPRPRSDSRPPVVAQPGLPNCDAGCTSPPKYRASKGNTFCSSKAVVTRAIPSQINHYRMWFLHSPYRILRRRVAAPPFKCPRQKRLLVEGVVPDECSQGPLPVIKPNVLVSFRFLSNISSIIPGICLYIPSTSFAVGRHLRRYDRSGLPSSDQPAPAGVYFPL